MDKETLKPCPFCGGVIECIDLKWRQRKNESIKPI